MKKIKVLHKKLLVRRQAEETVTAGGLLLPDNARQKISVGLGTVVQGVPDIPQGTRIVFNKFAGTDVDLEDKPNEYVILDARDVIAIYDEKGQI